MAKMSEQDVARVLVEHLKKTHEKVHQEVMSYHSGPVADVVAVAGRTRWVIETKTSLNFDVFEQAVFWLRYAHRVSVCVPASRRNRDIAEKVCAKFGIGVLTVSQWGGVQEVLAPEFRRKVMSMDYLRDEQATGEYADAGSAAGGHWTPFRATCNALVKAVQQAPGLTVKDYLPRITHHYATAASARASLMKWIAAGKVDGLRLQDGKLMVKE